MKHWDNQALIHGMAMEASWADYFAVQLEISEIGKFIHISDTVLDVGCGNGYATVQHKCKKMVGIDASQEMIKQAQKRQSSVHFEIGDATCLQFEDNSFDVVYTTRCIINLLTWEEQKKAISECMRVASRLVVLSEAFYEPLVKLNALRVIAGLKPLEEHDFNCYIKKAKLEAYLTNFKNIDFSSGYYLGSRFIRDIIEINDTDYKNVINKQFYAWQLTYPCTGFGIQQIYVIDV